MLPAQTDLDYVRRSYSWPATVEGYRGAFHTIAASSAERELFPRYLPAEGHVLDVGCGAGRASRVLSELGFQRVTGVDIAPPMVALASSLLSGVPGFSFSVLDVVHEALPRLSFDGAVAIHGLTPIPGFSNRITALRNIRAALLPGRSLIIASFLRDAAATSDDYSDGDILHTPAAEGAPPVYIHIPNRQELHTALCMAGFEVVEMISYESFSDSDLVHSSQRCFYTIARRSGDAADRQQDSKAE